MRDRFDDLGRELARHLPKEGNDVRRRAQEERLLRELSEQPEREAARRSSILGTRWAFVAGAAVAAAALAVVVWAPWSSRSNPEPLCVQRGGEAIASGSWLDSTAEAAAVLDFRDGSEVVTEGDTRIQLRSISGEEVRIVISRGKVRSRVRRRDRRWSFEAGPYRTRVLGTTLSVQWQPKTERLVVAVARGRVRVHGGKIEAEGVVVAAGMQLEAGLGHVVIRDARSPRAVPDAGADGPPAPQRDTTRKRPPRPLLTRWRDLARQGKHRRALSAAIEQGYGTLVRRLPAGDLLLLADAARLAGDVDRAREALLGCRRRFAASAPAHQAAFRLGRMAAEVRQSPAEAARWFRVFLREAPPRSSLRGDAMGRLVLALQRSGDNAAAATIAKRYLSQYPEGAYVAAARRALTGVVP